MSLEFLKPVAQELQEYAAGLAKGALGRKISFYEFEEGNDGINADIAIIGVQENRNENNTPRSYQEFNSIRKKFYSLYAGAWSLKIVDLGDILPGETVEDTYFLFLSVLQFCHRHNIKPCVIGGGQDLFYTAYRSLDDRPQMVNVCNVDAQFDLGDIDGALCSSNHIGKMVVDQPYHLFNYMNLGYQTYYNAQDEIALLEQLFFESVRLGELDHDITIAEPYLRSADLLGIDIGSLEFSTTAFAKAYPNGISGRQLCSLTRYAGIGERCEFIGFFNVPEGFTNQGCEVIAQALWYYFEGLELRIKEYPVEGDDRFISYEVLVEPENLKFLKSTLTDRWWIKVLKNDESHNIKNHHAFIACSHADYQVAMTGLLPERWLRARRKLDV